MAPEWLDIRATSDVNLEEEFKESERSQPHTLAGRDMDGKALNIASAVYNGLQVIGHSKHGSGLRYCSRKRLEGTGRAKLMKPAMSGPHAILANVNEYEWKTVTVKTLQACAEERGVDLTYFVDRRGERQYACRIDFYGWLDPISAAFSDRDNLITEGGEEDSKCLLPKVYRSGSNVPEFCYNGNSNRSLAEDVVLELLCYKQLKT